MKDYGYSYKIWCLDVGRHSTLLLSRIATSGDIQLGVGRHLEFSVKSRNFGTGGPMLTMFTSYDVNVIKRDDLPFMVLLIFLPFRGSNTL